MYTITKIEFSNLRFSLHSFKGIGKFLIGISKSDVYYTGGHDLMYHIRLGYLEVRFTFEY